MQLSDVGRRLAFAVRFRDINLLISGNIKDDSRLMFNRDIRDRVERAAPFLQWDGDPYAVVVDGKIKYVRDGYTTSGNYPYAQRIDLADAARRNELGQPRGARGSATTSATRSRPWSTPTPARSPCTPSTSRTPSSRPGARRSPTCSRPRARSPRASTRHLRYPEDLFSIQTWIYASYHIGDPDDFYSKEDFWALPDDRSGEIRRQEDTGGLTAASLGQGPPLLPPDQAAADRDEPEYVLVMPFTPNGKENMVSYLAAEADPGKYGQLTLYSLDRSRTILGPTQVNARILATPEISTSLTLLNQQGSRVILSNLLIVPVEESLLYVQPIFVQGSAPNSFPLLQRVAVFYNDQVGYADQPRRTPSARSSAASNPPSPHPTTAAPQPPPPTPGGGDESVQALLTPGQPGIRSRPARPRRRRPRRVPAPHRHHGPPDRNRPWPPRATAPPPPRPPAPRSRLDPLRPLLAVCYLRRRTAGWSSLVARWAHNPEVEGSNPSPATKIDQHVRRFTSSQRDSRTGLLSVICQWRARASVRALRLGWNRRGSGWPRSLAAWASMPGMTWL